MNNIKRAFIAFVTIFMCLIITSCNEYSYHECDNSEYKCVCNYWNKNETSKYYIGIDLAEYITYAYLMDPEEAKMLGYDKKYTAGVYDEYDALKAARRYLLDHSEEYGLDENVDPLSVLGPFVVTARYDDTIYNVETQNGDVYSEKFMCMTFNYEGYLIDVVKPGELN